MNADRIYLLDTKPSRPLSAQQQRVALGRAVLAAQRQGMRVHYAEVTPLSLRVQYVPVGRLNPLPVWVIVALVLSILVVAVGVSFAFVRMAEGVPATVGAAARELPRGIGAGIKEVASSPAGLVAIGLIGLLVIGGLVARTRASRGESLIFLSPQAPFHQQQGGA